MTDEAPSIGLFSGKRSRWVLGVLFAALVLAYGYALWEQANPFNDRPFDGETWRMYLGSDVPDSPRGKMAEAVTSDVLRPGMARDEVLALLGPPDPAGVGGSGEGAATAAVSGPLPADGPLRYYLGMWSGNRTHPDWLEVYFDDEGRLARTQIVSF